MSVPYNPWGRRWRARAKAHGWPRWKIRMQAKWGPGPLRIVPGKQSAEMGAFLVLVQDRILLGIYE